jgi:hypothetical protein
MKVYANGSGAYNEHVLEMAYNGDLKEIWVLKWRCKKDGEHDEDVKKTGSVMTL